MQILNTSQRSLLKAAAESKLGSKIYFTGGTLLSHHYLQHRLSVDLDFFSDDLLDDILVASEIKSIAGRVKAKNVRHVRFPNRWQYFFEFSSGEVKFDIVYFPFSRVAKRIILPEFDIKADSLKDIAVNKVHACFERDAPRDAFDLFCIMQKTGWRLRELLTGVEKKFGVNIDLVHLTAKLLASIDRLDDLKPLFIGKAPSAKKMKVFFEKESAQYLKSQLKNRP
ncbi:nucleotidyl transferase AbiEii/AbiGii toxin family protein [Candidatus Uhrbacteria bacterium]|nr:nucleotidyl transferase AbiEii/AbiGii toxin family protein [Candidatus Uhrbacteria bacterium]